MSVASFIPEVWSARLLATLSKSLVYGGVANRDYEGDIAQAGDTVHINNIVDPTVDDYVANTTSISPDQLTTTDQALVIDQAKYFAFYVDDVDSRQAAGNLINTATERAAYRLRDAADQFLATTLEAGAGYSETGAFTDSDDVWARLLEAKVALDEANVPTEARWAIVTPAVHALLMDNSKFLDASASGSTEPLSNGRVGRAAGFDIRVSNNASTDSLTAGHSMGFTYAEQIVSTEAYRPQDAFSDAVKGLHVYGARVVRPEAVAYIEAGA